MTNLLPSVEREYKDKIRQLQIEKEQVGSVILMEVTRLINTAEYLSEEQKTKLLIALWKGRAKKEITED